MSFIQKLKDSFLLLGPRATGKSTWIQDAVPAVATLDLSLDLLESDRFLDLSTRPSLLRQLCEPLKAGDWVVAAVKSVVCEP